LTHNFTSDQLRQLAARAIIANPQFRQMDGENGLHLQFAIYRELPGLTGAQWKKVSHFIATECPGLLDRTPPAENVLRRAREVRQTARERQQVQPAL
jgi:hypothetical protein